MIGRTGSELWKRMNADDAWGLAAQCAYYFLFSLFPFLLFVMSLLGYLPITANDLTALVHDYIPAGVMTELEEQVSQVLSSKGGGALSFGLLFSLFTASAAMDAIVLAVNKAYGLPARASFIHSRLLAIALTAGMLLVVGTALLLSVFGHAIGDWMLQTGFVSLSKVQLWNGLRWIISLLILFGVFLAIYYIAPNTCLTCKSVLPGAIMAAAGWQLTSLGFSYYVGAWSNYGATYGSLGGVIALMTWFYLSALIIVIGGELNAVLHAREEAPQPG